MTSWPGQLPFIPELPVEFPNCYTWVIIIHARVPGPTSTVSGPGCLVLGVPFSFDWTPARRAAILWSKRGIRHRNITFNFHWKVSSGNQKVRMCTYSRSWALSLWKSRFCFYWQFRFVRKTDEVNRENIELPTVSKENYWPSRISWASAGLELHKLQGPGSRTPSRNFAKHVSSFTRDFF